MNKTSTAANATERFADFASKMRFERLPSEVIPPLKGLLLDTIGTALAGSTLGDCCEAVGALVTEAGGKPESTVLGFGARVPAAQAAFANGALAHALNYDAGGAGAHPGITAVPAPLAVAQRRGHVSGKDFLTAMAVAIELPARVTAALVAARVNPIERFHNGQLLPYFGGALGAGRVLGLTPSQMHSALGLAVMHAGGSRQVSFEGGAAKAIYGSFPAQGAALCALLAERGVEAKCDALEGPAGFFSLFYGGRYEAAVITDGLGERFHATDIQFRLFPTSGAVHPFIEAALRLREQHRLTGDMVKAFHVAGPTSLRVWSEPLAKRRSPDNASSAGNSLFFGTAAALAYGRVDLANFTPQGLRDARVLRLTAGSDCTLDDALGDKRDLEVTLMDGTVLKATSEVPRGQDRPHITFDRLAVKFRDSARFAARPLTDAAVEGVIDAVARLETLDDVTVIPALLTAAA